MSTKSKFRLSLQEKPNANSRLQVLPEEAQFDIYEHTKQHSLHDTVAWLAESGVRTSISGVWRWRGWFARRLHLEANTEYLIETTEKELKGADLDEVQKVVFKRGQITFSRVAEENVDDKMWARIQNLRLKEAQLSLGTKALALREKESARKDEDSKPGGLSPETFDAIEKENHLM